MSTKKQRNGISLRTIHIFLVVGAVMLAGLMLYSTFYLTASFRNLTQISENNSELQKASYELMDASDYLTERAQRFAVSANKRLLWEYYDEAFTMKHREEAVERLSEGTDNTVAIANLENAMNFSKQLMQREYYSFRLVIEAAGIEDYPEVLNDVELSQRDKELSSQEKMNRAADIVFDNDYYSQKKKIKENMQASLAELEKQRTDNYDLALADMRTRMLIVRIMIVLETITVFFLVWLASHLGISPILKAVERIKNNNKIPEAGTTEFRYLVRAYNQMYEKYRKSLENLDYKASHDELTGVYNRAGYKTLVSSFDIDNMYMLMFDIDNFKSINDTYGHETGDMVLKKLVGVLKKNFRPDDFICRIGGDEFVVLMLHTPQKQQELIASKIDAINSALENTDDGLPRLSISVGIVHSSESDKVDELLKKTDVAMYQSKKKGKSTYTFYTPQINNEN